MVRTVSFACSLLLLASAAQAAVRPVYQKGSARATACWKLNFYGKTTEATGCFQDLARAASPADRAEAFWGLHNYNEANNQFRAAVAAEPKNADVRVRWGRLFQERFNGEDAAKLFGEALEIDKDNAEAQLGLAIVFSDRYEEKAVEMAQKALKRDPNLLEAQELLAQLALEDSNVEGAVTEANAALKMSPEALDAMAILASVDVLRDKPANAWLDKVFAVNPKYGTAYLTLGHFMELNRRYDEGIAFYRKALEIEPSLDEARAQLGVNLMRLGKDEEARQQLAKAYEDGYRNALTANTLTLLDSYKNFVTFRTPTTILKLHKKEAELLRPYIEAEMERAITTYEQKYKMKLKGPVQLEVYPDHEDFAVRTMGMPGLGALGVTFGDVVAMDSPSGRKPGSFHWASTLWHEFSHVYILDATNHRVPRWFTEGLAVYEETATSPDWGDRLDPGAIEAIRKKKLLPIAQLDRGFIRPSYPNQVVVSYFQAGKVCEYIAQTWGYGKLLDMVHSFAASMSTPDVIRKDLGVTPEQFDEKFLPWLEARTKKTVTGFDVWKKEMAEMTKASKEGKTDEVIADGLQIRDLYPEYVEHGSAYEQLADAYLAKNDKPAAIAQLQQYSIIGGRNPETLKKLAKLLSEAGKPKEAATALARLNYIYPMDGDAHQQLGDLWMQTGNTRGAIQEYQAVLAGKPLDPVASRYNLARAYRAANRTEDARDQLLLALEAAPGYKPAQRMLLEIAK